MGIKQTLKENKLTHNLYMFLFHWKYDGLRNAVILGCDKITRNELKPTVVVNKSGLNMDSYCLPGVLLENDINKKKITLFACANTVYAPEKGNSGGPGTVLATQKEVFGPRYNDIECRYVFESKPTRPAHLMRALREIPISNRFIIAAYAIEFGLEAWKDLDRYNEYIFICHDVGTAYGAYLRRCHYILIYHQQGALVSERISNGDPMTERDIEIANAVENIVFSNADQVYFPSIGARKAFESTTKMDCTKIKFSKYPLYNTIPDSTLKEDSVKLIKDYILNEEEREDTDVFLSIGDFSFNKGMERIPEFLKRYHDRTGRKIYWIAIGRKLKAGIYEKLDQEKKDWPFKSFLLGERINHDMILALMNYSDYYIMLHRASIFDLSTLEAMRAGNGIILSDIPGNTEFNKNNNVVLVDMDNMEKALVRLSDTDKMSMSKLNKATYNEYFSKHNFYKEYSRMIDEELDRLGYLSKQTGMRRAE